MLQNYSTRFPHVSFRRGEIEVNCKEGIVSSDVVGIDVAIEDGVDGEPGYGLYSQLLGDVLAVRDDGGEAYVQAVGNLLVHQSAGNECQHLDLAC